MRLNFCMLLPGPEAMQLATYVGWRLHGTLGGLAAGLLFVLPGAIVVLGLSILYAYFGQVPIVEAAFVGIKAAVLVIVVEALLRVARRALRRPYDVAIAIAAFVAIFFFAAPFPLIIAQPHWRASRCVRPRPAEPPALPAVPVALIPHAPDGRGVACHLDRAAAPGERSIRARACHDRHRAVLLEARRRHLRRRLSVLAYMAQQAVETYGWLSAGEMLDGLGLAETTPGPLILVTEFVGFLAGFRKGGEPALAFGLLGAAVTLWATFAPCFLWIFTGAPYVERLSANPRLAGALAGVTAAVVGVILNLSLWFALHVLFGNVAAVWHGPLRLWTPELASLRLEALLLSGWRRCSCSGCVSASPSTLALTAGAALAWSLLSGCAVTAQSRGAQRLTNGARTQVRARSL